MYQLILNVLSFLSIASLRKEELKASQQKQKANGIFVSVKRRREREKGWEQG